MLQNREINKWPRAMRIIEFKAEKKFYKGYAENVQLMLSLCQKIHWTWMVGAPLKNSNGMYFYFN